MSQLSVKFYSNSLSRYTTFETVIPNDIREHRYSENGSYGKRKMKTLFLLHGYSDCGTNWMPEYLTEKYNFAVVIPNGENAFWLDGISTGHKYCTFLGEELTGYVRRTFGLAEKPEDTYIMGYSMGGFGALHTALAYPKIFGKTAALSSALITRDIAGMKPGEDNGVANYEYYRECFGELDKVLESDNDPETLVKKLKDRGENIPEIFMACGTEDFLIENNRRFHRFLDELGIGHFYEESGGGHDMSFWNKYAVKFAEMMFGQNKA
ncbi:MAG: alpha/beta hydrolase-fold protein [Ruminococcus sp.]|nr:alpha/beta hydrolase-fold protein [Ruminococcus sp.]